MQYFFLSGAPNTGKTMTIHAICGWLLSIGYIGNDLRQDGQVYIQSTTFPVLRVNDFSFLMQKGGVKVLVHSATDDVYNINMLADFISTYTPDVVISSCRDYLDWPRNYLCQKLGLTNDYELSTNNPSVQEFPMGKITRRNNWSDAHLWYFRNTLKCIKMLLTSTPYSL
jgi:hypothetical protein